MIQRIQTLYLTTVMLISLVLFIPSVPFAFVESARSNEFNMSLSVSDVTTKWVSIHKPPSYLSLLILNACVMLLALITIFKYKKRMQQGNLCLLNILIVLLLFAAMWYFSEWYFSDVIKHKMAEPDVTYLWGFYLPPVQVVLLYFAGKAIRRDEDLVRSADRIR